MQMGCKMLGDYSTNIYYHYIQKLVALIMHQARKILRNTFGFSDFRPFQEQVIQTVLRKRDALVVMPTGGGKSLCYQIPALLFERLTIVVSPLISLMKDQVEQLREYGVPTAYLNSTLSPDEYHKTLNQIRDGSLKLLYAAPETLTKPSVLGLLEQVQPDCLTIDEAHCISEWGHDFRPEYRQLSDIRQRFSNAVCLGLTATATPYVRRDILKNLELHQPKEVVASFDRPNLFLEIRNKSNALGQTVDFLKKRKEESGIIYCFSRRQVDELADDLQAYGYSVRPYHAGMTEQDRNANQEAFIRDEVQIIVATVAFGMGIDKPNVRFVIHYDLPKNIEAYYQQIGRAGRDGLDSHCLLLFNYADIHKIKYLIDQKEDEKEKRVAENHLNELVGFVESNICRRVALLNYFGESYEDTPCRKCDNCLRSDDDLEDLTIPAQKFLSCVVRTGERFGAGHIIDVLRGSQSQKVLQRGHNELSTYDIGNELSVRQWKQLATMLIQQNYLDRDPEFGGLHLADKAAPLLKNETRFFGMLEEEKQDFASRGGVKSTEIDYDEALFRKLRYRRKQEADKKQIPPYAIFHDRTLMEMSAYYPLSKESMLQVHGVGKAKFEKYGKTMLNLVRRYYNLEGIEGDRMPATLRGAGSSGSRNNGKKKKPRHVQVGEQFNDGKSISELAGQYSVKHTTIVDHLTRFAQDGYPLREAAGEVLSFADISKEKIEQVFEAFQQRGMDFLRPVYEALDESVSYGDLKLARLALWMGQEK